MQTYRISWKGHCLELGSKTQVMGILNTTPDSFSDGGHFFRPEEAVIQGQKMFEAGADIIDIGGESTKPFSEPVSIEEETRRVIPVIEKLARLLPVPISIDTTKTVIARRAIDVGACIINDISAMKSDPDMASFAAESKVPVILMHMKGTPKSMQVSPQYDDLVKEVRDFFKSVIADAREHGVDESKIIIDPGIGFGKTMAHNLMLINNLEKFQELNVPILVGTSRKSFIRKLLKSPAEKDIPPDLPIVETGTQATVAASIINGAHIVRVHDVTNTCATVKIIDAIKNA
ncbi:dihydropteroate synthase [Desulfobacterales bacterium HSG16]|nr:dihydropteroate synthase [Desulfobacterales bacterium HSG16]